MSKESPGTADTKDEIQDIMNEIENLKQNIATPPEMKTKSAPPSESSQIADEEKASEELASFLEDDIAPVIPLNPGSLESESDFQEGSLELTLGGRLTLRVSTVQFSEQGLNVKLADGTEFKIPLRQNQTHRKVA